MAGNQHKPDPRQALFLEYFLDKDSETFSNALQSALKAGYSQEYSENIKSLMPKWLSEKIADDHLVKKAENRLQQILDFQPVDEEGKLDNSLISNQIKLIQLVLKGLEKNRYSERAELTGAGGQALTMTFDNSFDK